MTSVISKRQMLITTSWDDGHPLDLRIAELLSKYDLPGTFYIPMRNSRPTLSPAQMRDLAQRFEIGAHTVNHLRLRDLDPVRAKNEIVDCKRQLEDILGRPCPLFCFPGGSYNSFHLDMLRDAGFRATRTVELLSLDRPQTRNGVAVMPTTIQAYSHGFFSYFRNVAKRASVKGLTNLVFSGVTKLWSSLAESLLERAAASGGVFHLWGHSWEIEQYRFWPQLEVIFRALVTYRPQGQYVTNGELSIQSRHELQYVVG